MKKNTWIKSIRFMFALSLICAAVVSAKPAQRWSVDKANKWYAQQGWLVGCNFSPSTAINQLEMWQADTFDPETIDRELGWAEGIGMNVVRVYLHDLLWQQDSEGFCKRIDEFLAIADKHGIKTMFVPLDSVWYPYPKLGKQPEPKPHVHNSGWMQSPSLDLLKDPARHDELKPYITGLLKRYKNDKRILLWDLYNEPENNNVAAYGDIELSVPEKAALQLKLVEKLFQWGREVNPSQPLSVCLWIGDWREGHMSALDQYAADHSDIITYHNYDALTEMQSRTKLLERFNRPLICTEYMARPRGSTFEYMLPFFKKHNIGAINWGFVAGKSQTIYPWDSWQKQYTAEPPVWFHDVFRPDGTPYDANEVAFIKMMTDKE